MADRTLTEQAEQLLTAYCAGVDGHHLDQIRAQFTPDGTFFARGTLMTAPERDAFFTQLWATTDERSTHVCREVRATGTGDTVSIEARLTATFILADGTVRIAFGRYEDLAEVTAAGLRLTAKRINLDRVEVMTPDSDG